jgi:hypothetical protein
MAKSKPTVLTPRQQGVVDHFGSFIKDAAARKRYVALVEAALPSLPDNFSDLNVTAVALRAFSGAMKPVQQIGDRECPASAN